MIHLVILSSCRLFLPSCSLPNHPPQVVNTSLNYFVQRLTELFLILLTAASLADNILFTGYIHFEFPPN